MNWIPSDGSLKRGRPLLGRAIVTEIALGCLAVTAIVESVAYSVLFSVSSCCNHVRNWSKRRLQSSTVTYLWALSDLLMYNLFYRNIYTHESFARRSTQFSRQEDGAYCDQVHAERKRKISSTFQEVETRIEKSSNETAELETALQDKMREDLQAADTLRGEISECDRVFSNIEGEISKIVKPLFSKVPVPMQNEARECFNTVQKEREEWKQKAEECLKRFTVQESFQKERKKRYQELHKWQQEQLQDLKDARTKFGQTRGITQKELQERFRQEKEKQERFQKTLRELIEEGKQTQSLTDELSALQEECKEFLWRANTSFRVQKGRMEKEVPRQEALIRLKSWLDEFLQSQKVSLEMVLMNEISNLEQRLSKTESFNRGLLTQQEEKRIEAGVAFLCSSILARTTQRFDDRFEELDGEMIEYILAKSIWIYVGGSKREEEVLEAFKKKTRGEIISLRTCTKKGELDSVFVNMNAYVNRPKENVPDTMKTIQNAVVGMQIRELQGGIFITKCWQEAINRHLRKKGACFLRQYIFNEASVLFKDCFEKFDLSIALYMLVKAIWIYSCGAKRGHSIGLFKDETRMKIEDLREAFKENELETLFVDIESFERALSNDSQQAVLDLFCAVAVNEMQDGIIVTECWKEAVNHLAQIKK